MNVNSAAVLGIALGIGTDLISQDRIALAVERHGQRFAQRILSPDEMDIYLTHSNPINYLAKAFAAKEALSKALGTGIAQGVSFHDFSIIRDEHGAPQVGVRGRAEELMYQKSTSARLLISLSDEGTLVQAFAVLSS